jgi:hypothetical protein
LEADAVTLHGSRLRVHDKQQIEFFQTFWKTRQKPLAAPCVKRGSLSRTIGSITFVFAPHPLHLSKNVETVKIQLQNYGAKDMVHNNAVLLVFAT